MEEEKIDNIRESNMADVRRDSENGERKRQNESNGEEGGRGRKRDEEIERQGRRRYGRR